MKLKSLVVAFGSTVLKLEIGGSIRSMELDDGLVRVLVFNAVDGSMKTRFINMMTSSWWEFEEQKESQAIEIN